MATFTNTIDSLGDQETLDALVSGTITEYKDNVLTSICNYAFDHQEVITSADLPNLKTIEQYGFQYCRRLKDVNFPEATTINTYAFQHCNSLRGVSLPKSSSAPGYIFAYSTAGVVPFDNAATIGVYVNQYEGASGFDFTNKITIVFNAFSGGYNLCTLILRSSELCPLSNTNAFTNTPIAAGYGFVYVPSGLVDTYKSATNWSTYADQIVSIDEYPKFVEGTITDSWEDIFTAESNGTYSTKYSLGDTKVVYINDTPIPMQIVAFDQDDLADNTGKAKITWLSVGRPWSIPMNFTVGTTGRWAESFAREYMQNSIYPYIDSMVKARIKEVHKPYYDYSTNSVLTVDDKVWIPSYYEMTGSTGWGEKTGAAYTDMFGENTTDTRKIKKRGMYNLVSANSWWLRSAWSSTDFRCVSSTGGTAGSSGASSTYGLVLGFCT